MKYRVRVDLSFDSEADARLVLEAARQLSGKAGSVNEGRDNEEVSFCELERCRHDEGLPCERLERVEIGGG